PPKRLHSLRSASELQQGESLVESSLEKIGIAASGALERIERFRLQIGVAVDYTQRNERVRFGIPALQNPGAELSSLSRIPFTDRLRGAHDRFDVLAAGVVQPPTVVERLARQFSLPELLVQFPHPVIERA